MQPEISRHQGSHAVCLYLSETYAMGKSTEAGSGQQLPGLRATEGSAGGDEDDAEDENNIDNSTSSGGPSAKRPKPSS